MFSTSRFHRRSWLRTARSERQRRVGLSTASGVLVVAVGVAASWSATAWAGGYRTPASSAARHLGVGGAVVGGVDDVTSITNNPAGLAALEGVELTAAGTLMVQTRFAVPLPAAGSESSTSFDGFPFLGAGLEAADWLSIGVAGTTLARQAVAYEFSRDGVAWNDRFSSSIFELSPAISLTVPDDFLAGNLAFGAGYRLTLARLDRFRGSSTAAPLVDADSFGMNGSGIRLGAQYSPLPELRLGMAFENPVTTTTSSETAVISENATELRAPVSLPLRLAAGFRMELDRWGLLADYEFADHTGSEAIVYRGEARQMPVSVVEQLGWREEHTVRVGLEHRWARRGAEIPLRVGYALETAVARDEFPSIWGTPPAPAHTLTIGSGYRDRRFSLNLGLAYRFSGTTILGSTIGPDCDLCAGAGEAELAGVSVALDGSYRFDL